MLTVLVEIIKDLFILFFLKIKLVQFLMKLFDNKSNQLKIIFSSFILFKKKFINNKTEQKP